MFGLRGEVKLAADPSIVKPGLRVLLKLPNGGERSVTIEAVRPHKNILVARLQGVADAQAAKALQGASVLVARDDLPALPDGSYREADLIGLSVVDATQGLLGRVREVRHYPSCDMLVVGEGDLLVPMLRAYDVKVELAKGEIQTKLPEGFEELT